MKKQSKLIMLVLVLSLSIGFTAFAAECRLSKGEITAKGELTRSGKSGTAGTYMTSKHLYYVTTVVTAYDKSGKALAANNRTSRTAAYTSVTPSKSPYKFVSTHAIKDDNYRPYCSNTLIVY